MAYDKMKWHYGGDYPKNLPTENGGTHIGFFIAWCINNNLMSEDALEDCEDELEQVKAREITGRDFLITMLDETFCDEDLNDEGNAFATYYYENELYHDDLDETLGGDIELDSFYETENSWTNYDLLSPVIDKRFEEWKISNSK